MSPLLHLLQKKIAHHLNVIYAGIELSEDLSDLAQRLIQAIGIKDESNLHLPVPNRNNWSQRDMVLITYADSILHPDEVPLKTLYRFLTTYCSDSINSVHILPFFPYSSDDGFSVIDYSSVNEYLGDWSDIKIIANDYTLMADLVINHCSARSAWFQNFIQGEGIGKDYFMTASQDDDLSKVIRPRTSSLLRETETKNGLQYVWCTFSHDQVDFDFTNPEVLHTFVSIIRQYLFNGARIFRLDAVAFLWKEIGSSCINLPQTHEVIRLLRTLIEHAEPDAVIITETNIPNRENLTYFGNANEAHAIYNFSLPPLLVNSLVTGSCRYLKTWMMSMPPAQNGTTYFNFIASHDGLGLRPAEGLLSNEELTTLVETMQSFGGRVSWRASESGKQKAYEINIALYDALQGTTKGPDKWGFERFICAHTIMFGLEGVPGIYIHSLLGTGNDHEKVKNTGQNRSINRHRWHYPDLQQHLDDPSCHHNHVLGRLTELIQIRQRQEAFHPNATQFTLQLGDHLFGFWRQSLNRRQSIFCISNVTDEILEVSLSDINLAVTDDYYDLITGATIDPADEYVELNPYQTIWLSNMVPDTYNSDVDDLMRI